jgi:polysaccharide chain length determinant protein (PEP-CTERM system associated)
MPPQDASRGNQGLDALRAVIARRYPLALAVFAGAFAVAASVVAFLPDVYRSSATVLIERQQIPDELVRSTVTSQLEIRLQTISQEILSRSRLEPLIEQFGLYADLKKRAPVEEVIERMRNDIRLDLKGGDRRRDSATVAFTLSYTGSDPEKVALVTNTLASYYIQENLKVRERQATGTAEFLRVQLEQMKARLEEQERHVTLFKERHMGELPQQMEANLKTLEQLNGQLRLNNDSQVQVSERRAVLARQLEDAENAATPDGPRAAGERLAELRRQLTDLRSRYTERYPDVARVKAEIATLETQLRDSPPAADARSERDRAASLSPHLAQLRQAFNEVELQGRALRGEAENLRRAISLYQLRVENAPKREQEFQGLARDYETGKELYRSLLVRQKEAELAESMEQRQKGEQFRIIDPATTSHEPAAPRRPQMLLMAFLLSLGLAFAVTLAAERIDTSFHSSEDVRLFARLPVVARIPPIVTPRDRVRKRRRAAVVAVSSVVSLGLLIGLSYFAVRQDGSFPGLLLRSLR